MRCKACEVPLAPCEIQWDDRLKNFEPLCLECRLKIVEEDLDLTEKVLTDEEIKQQ